MGNAIHQAVLHACRNFMIPIARFLLRHGITFKEFAEVAKWAFVHVATEEYGIRGRKTNISRVAVMTGLSRKEVSGLREEAPPGSELEKEWRIASDALRAWHTNLRLLDDLGEPRALPLEGDLSFSSLVRALTKDREPLEVLDLLLEAGSISRGPDGSVLAKTRYYIPPYSDVRAVHYFGEALRNLATTIESNYNRKRNFPRFERFVWSDALPAGARVRFQRILSDQATRLLEILDDWLSTQEDSSAAELGEKVGVGIYYFDTSDSHLNN